MASVPLRPMITRGGLEWAARRAHHAAVKPLASCVFFTGKLGRFIKHSERFSSLICVMEGRLCRSCSTHDGEIDGVLVKLLILALRYAVSGVGGSRHLSPPTQMPLLSKHTSVCFLLETRLFLGGARGRDREMETSQSYCWGFLAAHCELLITCIGSCRKLERSHFLAGGRPESSCTFLPSLIVYAPPLFIHWVSVQPIIEVKYNLWVLPTQMYPV